MGESPNSPDGSSALRGQLESESTLGLLGQAQQGSEPALAALLERFRPRLLRWSTGRIPAHARGVLETQDLVQEVLVRTVRRIDLLEARSRGEFHSYLRQALKNRIRDEIRRVDARPKGSELHGHEADAAPSPLEQAIGREQAARYEAALARLKPEDREAIVAKLELSCSYAELAEVLGKPSADAARMTVSRALLRLAQEIANDEP
ncbi:MAG: sigma-70 family RNA polymerase sigma factor [Candidatus Eisenbacteria bacterium]